MRRELGQTSENGKGIKKYSRSADMDNQNDGKAYDR